MRAPAHLGKLGKEAWRKLRDLLKARDFLDTSDASLLEMWAASYEIWRMARRDVMSNGILISEVGSTGFEMTKKNPAVEVMNKSWTELKALIPEFGLSPSARAKLAGSTPTEDEFDPLEVFINTAPN